MEHAQEKEAPYQHEHLLATSRLKQQFWVLLMCTNNTKWERTTNGANTSATEVMESDCLDVLPFVFVVVQVAKDVIQVYGPRVRNKGQGVAKVQSIGWLMMVENFSNLINLFYHHYD